MQTLDIQKEVQPVQHASTTPANHTAALPKRKGSSFSDMIQKILAAVPADTSAANKAEGALAVEMPVAADAAAKLGLLQEKTIQKKNMHQHQTMKLPLARQPAAAKRARIAVDTAQDIAGYAEQLETVPEILSLLRNDESKVEVQAVKKDLIADSEILYDEEAILLPALLPDSALMQKKEQRTSSLLKEEKITAFLQKETEIDEQKEEKPYPVRNSVYHAGKTQKPLFTIIDERSASSAEQLHSGVSHDAGTEVLPGQHKTIDMLMDCRTAVPFTSQNTEGGLFTKESAAPSFASVLAQQVQDMSADFVQAGKIVLQDNNVGLIRLQMQPAHLGNIKISLELTGDKRVSGKIIASSKEAYEAFKECAAQLADAFEQGGFTAAQFDVSWSGEHGGSQFAQEDRGFKDSFKKEPVEVMQANPYADNETIYDAGSDLGVNVFA